MQSYVVFANTKAFADAGVEIPTGDSLNWEELATISKALTKDGKYGLGWGLAAPFARSPTWPSASAAPSWTSLLTARQP